MYYMVYGAKCCTYYISFIFQKYAYFLDYNNSQVRFFNNNSGISRLIYLQYM